MRNLWLAPLLLAIMGIGAQAQVIQQSQIEFYDQSVSGQPAICGVEFTFVFVDNLYGTKLLGGMTGSIAYAVANGSLGTMFKVSAASGDNKVQVYSASIKAQNQLLQPKQMVCEDKRNFCGGFYNDDNGKIMSALGADKLEVRYNIRPRGIDYAFPISFYNAANKEKGLEFFHCVKELLRVPHT
ncbi:hypothetical protein [Rhodoblastus sp.]|uniref:hypothetical protein n=1 Tax=Rhodoblastus sp. TaxID=1962975 RepID=UPI003F951FC5